MQTQFAAPVVVKGRNKANADTQIKKMNRFAAHYFLSNKQTNLFQLAKLTFERSFEANPPNLSKH
jgi:hypothetical protein